MVAATAALCVDGFLSAVTLEAGQAAGNSEQYAGAGAATVAKALTFVCGSRPACRLPSAQLCSLLLKAIWGKK